MPHIDHWRNGNKLVSVTEIPAMLAKPFLDNWRIKLCHCQTHAVDPEKKPLKAAEEEIIRTIGVGHCGTVYADIVKDDAADLGNEVHKIIEEWFKNPDLEWVKDSSEEALIWANKIVNEYKLHGVVPRIIRPEENLLDEDGNLAGSPDTVGEWNGRVEILDTKIKNQLDKTTAFQGMGYRYLLLKLKKEDVRYMRPVWCDKSTKSKMIKTDLTYDLDLWVKPWYSLVEVWNTMHTKRKINLIPWDTLIKSL